MASPKYWHFNTNETNGRGAYNRMFARDVAAIWGYDDGPKTLQGSAPGDIVLAYVNGPGLCAVGTVVDGQVTRGTNIFFDKQGRQRPEEYHLQVSWQLILPLGLALSSVSADAMGCTLPVRDTFANISREKGERLERELRSRKSDT